MGLSRIDLQIVRNLRLNQHLHKLNRVSDMHVVITRPMDQQEMSLQFRRRIDHREILILILRIFGTAKVPLRVDGIVTAPIRNRRERDPGREPV